MTIRSTAVPEAEELRALEGQHRDQARDDRALALDVCSVCLRVRTGERWGEASEFIPHDANVGSSRWSAVPSVLCASCTRTSSGQAIEKDSTRTRQRARCLTRAGYPWLRRCTFRAAAAAHPTRHAQSQVGRRVSRASTSMAMRSVRLDFGMALPLRTQQQRR